MTDSKDPHLANAETLRRAREAIARFKSAPRASDALQDRVLSEMGFPANEAQTEKPASEDDDA